MCTGDPPYEPWEIPATGTVNLLMFLGAPLGIIIWIVPDIPVEFKFIVSGVVIAGFFYQRYLHAEEERRYLEWKKNNEHEYR